MVTRADIKPYFQVLLLILLLAVQGLCQAHQATHVDVAEGTACELCSSCSQLEQSTMDAGEPGAVNHEIATPVSGYEVSLTDPVRIAPTARAPPLSR